MLSWAVKPKPKALSTNKRNPRPFGEGTGLKELFLYKEHAELLVSTVGLLGLPWGSQYLRNPSKVLVCQVCFVKI